MNTPALAPTPIPDLAHIKARLDHLFRLTLRRQEINPLMHLVWRYRTDLLAKR